MKILGIESSCDDTAVAVVTDKREILANVVLSQIKQHQPYGGVVPEIAARAHIDAIEMLTKEALRQSGDLQFSDFDAIAVTRGPGLIGGVIVGVMYAKAIAAVTNLPIIGVNHLEGHALTVRLTNENVVFPFLLLLVSGGHCQMLAVESVGKYKCYGVTLDDALGECFDKVAKMLGLGYPGGPIVEKYATEGDEKRFSFPKSMLGRQGADFSFSGLKTAVKKEIDNISNISLQDKKDICASFQLVVKEILNDRISNAIELFKMDYPGANQFVVSGGVAANRYLIGELDLACKAKGFSLISPPIRLCTDNAAMIAWAGVERFTLGLIDDLNFEPLARMKL